MRGYPRNQLTERSGTDPVVTRTTRSRGHTISYDDAGTGPVIVLIPGSTMSAADWRDAGYVDALAGSHRVVSVDPLGNGLSDKPHDPDEYAWPDVATDIVAVMDAAGIDRAVVWGYSRGGGLAAAVAADYPDRVTALILHDGWPAEIAKGSPPTEFAEAMSRGDFALLWDGGGFTFSEADRRYDEEFNDPRALGAMAVGPRRSGCAVDLERVIAPALVIGSVDDPDGDKLVADRLGVDVQALAGLDHLEAFSRLDLVMPLVTGFLESHGL